MTVTNLTEPAITGTARQGQLLRTSDGTWSFDLDYLTYAYQWLRCDAAGANCVDIAGATAAQYSLVAADVGSTIRSEVTATEHANTPTPPGPTDLKLRWAPPTLSSPTVRALTQASHTFSRGSGQDLRITAAAEDITTSIGQIEGYGDVEAIGGKLESAQQNEGHIIPRENTGTFHWEGWYVRCTGAADAFTCRWRQPILQIQACYVEVTTAGTSHHSDGFQTQEAIINELRMDRCTFKTDYQGIFLSNEPQNAGPARSKVSKQIFSRILFLPGARGLPATFFFKAFPPRPNADPIGPTEMYDVWMPNSNPVKVYPSTTWNAWDGSPQRYGCFVTTKLHSNGNTYKFLKFSTGAETVTGGSLSGQTTGDCQVNGDGGIWLYDNISQVPAGVGAPANAGRSYVSPGYQ